MGPKAPQPVSVSGGSNGVEAHYDDMVAMARLFGKVATDACGASLSLHGYVVDPGIACSALFDPGGAANFEADLLDALDGSGGLSWIALQCALIDTELRAAASAYQEADRLGTTLQDQVGGLVHLGPSAAHAVELLVTTGNIPRSLQSVLTDDPALVDELMNAGLLSLDAVVAPLYADGRAKLADHGIDTDPLAATPPRNLADVMAGLALRNNGVAGDVLDVWMSHGDRIEALPPGFHTLARSPNSPFAAMGDDARRWYGIQFHPEVMHTRYGRELLRNFPKGRRGKNRRRRKTTGPAPASNA